MDIDGHTQHISQQFNSEMEALKARALEMGGLVEQQVQRAIQSLFESDTAMAEEVRAADKKVNKMEVSIDEQCMKILALRQPAASDLRLVMAVSRATTDLERMGDEAEKIARQAIELSMDERPSKGYVELKHIGNQVLLMVHAALDAFARFDPKTALEVAEQDKDVDVEYGTAMRLLVTCMMEDPRSISRVLSIMWALRAMERIGDHARNLAEHVIYLSLGKDVRHTNLTRMAEQINNPGKQ